MAGLAALLTLVGRGDATPVYTVQPAGSTGFDVYADGVLVAPIRLAANGAIVADQVTTNASGIRLSALRAKDSAAVTFAADDFVSLTFADTNATPGITEPTVEFKLTLVAFNTNKWLALFPGAPAPFHFLICALPTAQVWHQRGWLNATPVADPFPLLQDEHVGAPELSCLWNRNWSYLCPLGGHPIPLIGLWDPPGALYVGYDFQGARVADGSERFLGTAYCWGQNSSSNFITLAYPAGGSRFGEQVYPKGGEELASWFHLEIDTQLPDTEDPNERFQARLFARYPNALPRVPAMNDLGWIPGSAQLGDFPGAPGLTLYGSNDVVAFRPTNSVVLRGWTGHRELPFDTAIDRGSSVSGVRAQMENLLTNYAQVFTVGGDSCLYWTKPLAGAWFDSWGGTNVTSRHNSEGWFAARVLVELYRYDVAHGVNSASHLQAIDRLFNWARHFVWSRNEFDDVPSSPFAIGSTLASAFLLDYYFTFRNDPQRATNATLALHLAGNVTWRYLQCWAMDSDRTDGLVDSAFLAEPNSGRDWAALGCANEVNWNLDGLTQVYVHTGDARMRYYLRGMLQRWPALYRTVYHASIAQYGSDSLTEGYGLFDGAGPGRGGRYDYGFTEPLPFNEPIGASRLRVIAGVAACIAFNKAGDFRDVTDYRTDGTGKCSFRIVSTNAALFDVSFSYPYVDISQLAVTRKRGTQTVTLGTGQIQHPAQSPSSLYFVQLQNNDIITIGALAANTPTNAVVAPLTYDDAVSQAVTNGAFVSLGLAGNYPLPMDWSNVHSFAGLVCGQRWTFGVPYQQHARAATNVLTLNPANLPGGSAVVVAYAPPPDQVLIARPQLVLDDNSTLALAGRPVQAWRGWPMVFDQTILLDYALVPAGRTLQQLNPSNTLVMDLTVFTGPASEWQPYLAGLSNAASAFIQAQLQNEALALLRTNFSTLPAGKMALLPLNTGGAAANFAALTGLDAKWQLLTEAQSVDPNYFTASRFPLAFYLGSENYVKTVVTTGDAKTNVMRYLASGGTLIVLATGPFPFYYGYGPNDQAGPSDVMLPQIGLPIGNAFEQPPVPLGVAVTTNQSVLHSGPATFPFPPGDQRLRSVNRSQVLGVHRYIPWLVVTNGLGQSYGDAACRVASWQKDTVRLG